MATAQPTSLGVPHAAAALMFWLLALFIVLHAFTTLSFVVVDGPH